MSKKLRALHFTGSSQILVSSDYLLPCSYAVCAGDLQLRQLHNVSSLRAFLSVDDIK